MKFMCPKHHGDSLHVYHTNAYCFGKCGSMDNIDLVRAVHGCDFNSAVRWLHEKFPETCEKCYQPGPEPERRSVDVELQRDVFERLVQCTELTRTGRRYIATRGLDPDRAERTAGLRSVDADYWQRLRAELDHQFGASSLQTAGLGGLGRFNSHTAWPVPVDVLVIPYWDLNGRLLTCRFRCITDGNVGHKYHSYPGTGVPTLPFGANLTLPKCDERIVHVTEGELDAWTLISEYDEMAVGAPGAQVVSSSWFTHLVRCAGVVIWCDGDEAGSAFGDRVDEALLKALGRAWWRSRHVARETLPNGLDVNALHCSDGDELGKRLGAWS
jgi:DNA primase